MVWLLPGDDIISEYTKSADTSSIQTALALRDFFLATSGDELACALANLQELPEPGRSELSELEYEFNRLFVGPAPPEAPPYASVYLEAEPVLMADSTAEIGRFYAALGLKEPTGGLPPDFLPLELEAWVALKCMSEAIPDVMLARQFLMTHLGKWLPSFIAKMRKAGLSPVMAQVASALEAWLQYEKEKLWEKTGYPDGTS